MDGLLVDKERLFLQFPVFMFENVYM